MPMRLSHQAIILAKMICASECPLLITSLQQVIDSSRVVNAFKVISVYCKPCYCVYFIRKASRVYVYLKK